MTMLVARATATHDDATKNAVDIPVASSSSGTLSLSNHLRHRANKNNKLLQ